MWSEFFQISKELDLVDSYIKNNISSRNKLLTEAVYELIQAGGKRLRPALVVASAQIGKYKRDKIIPAASAVEILHTATLVHDDIIDRAPIRRGKETIYRKFGVDMAVYCGDFLFTKSVLMLSGVAGPDKLDLIAKTVKSICEGEVDQFNDRYNTNKSTFSYIKGISKKTALLFSASCVLGAGISECKEYIIKSLARFGYYFGMAFQIKDDINDFVMDTMASGKAVGIDISKGIITLPVIYALSKDNEAREQLIPILDKKENISIDEVMKVVSIVKKAGGIDYSIGVLNRYTERAMKVLDKLPENRSKVVFKYLIDRL